MIQIRPFCNADPPGLVEIWRSQPPLRRIMQPMSISLLEQLIFSRPYFDRQGLLVAERDGSLVGFVHAAWGARPDLSDVDPSVGVNCVLMTLPHAEHSSTRKELLAAAENYLAGQGVQQLFGGCHWPHTPFYLGLYGGSSLPGVLDADQQLGELYLQSGYTVSARHEIWQRDLNGFRGRVDRRALQIRREFVIDAVKDEPWPNWWTACVLSSSYHVTYRLIPKTGGAAVASATFWDMEPLASSWGIHAMGLVELQVDSSRRRQGLGLFLLSEALRQLQSEGISIVECQATADNDAARQLFLSLGFQLQETGTVYQKP